MGKQLWSDHYLFIQVFTVYPKIVTVDIDHKSYNKDEHIEYEIIMSTDDLVIYCKFIWLYGSCQNFK